MNLRILTARSLMPRATCTEKLLRHETFLILCPTKPTYQFVRRLYRERIEIRIDDSYVSIMRPEICRLVFSGVARRYNTLPARTSYLGVIQDESRVDALCVRWIVDLGDT